MPERGSPTTTEVASDTDHSPPWAQENDMGRRCDRSQGGRERQSGSQSHHSSFFTPFKAGRDPMVQWPKQLAKLLVWQRKLRRRLNELLTPPTVRLKALKGHR